MKRSLYVSIALNGLLVILIIVGTIIVSQKVPFGSSSPQPVIAEGYIEDTYQYARNEMRSHHFGTIYSTPTDVVFLGDSLTDYFEWAEVYPSFNVKNRGLAGDTSTQVLSRMDTILQLQPDKIFLMIGVNDFKEEDMTPYDTAENIRSIIRAVKASPDEITLYVQSILPSTRDPEGIVLANSLIQAICEEEDITYIDLHSIFAKEDNTIKAEMTYDDLHLSTYGYWTWLQAIDIYINEYPVK